MTVLAAIEQRNGRYCIGMQDATYRESGQPLSSGDEFVDFQGRGREFHGRVC